LALLVAGASRLPAQTRGAELVREQKPAYPEALHKASAQGSVVLIARIDRDGAVQDARPLWSSNQQFVASTLQAVKAWAFRPALLDGKPIDIAANIVFPFRIRDEKGQIVGYEISGPALHDLAVFPADASGRKTAPEGFPIHKGADQRMRVEAALDLPRLPAARKVPVQAEAVSPGGRRVPAYRDSILVPAKTTEVKLPFSVPIGDDWEDGVWKIQFTADGAPAGTGQFWLARDPARFDFASAMRQLK
jgi:TonB family protein